MGPWVRNWKCEQIDPEALRRRGEWAAMVKEMQAEDPMWGRADDPLWNKLDISRPVSRPISDVFDWKVDSQGMSHMSSSYQPGCERMTYNCSGAEAKSCRFFYKPPSRNTGGNLEGQ